MKLSKLQRKTRKMKKKYNGGDNTVFQYDNILGYKLHVIMPYSVGPTNPNDMLFKPMFYIKISENLAPEKMAIRLNEKYINSFVIMKKPEDKKYTWYASMNHTILDRSDTFFRLGKMFNRYKKNDVQYNGAYKKEVGDIIDVTDPTSFSALDVNSPEFKALRHWRNLESIKYVAKDIVVTTAVDGAINACSIS